MQRLSIASASLVCATVLGFFTFPSHASAYAGMGPLIPMIGNGIVLIFMFVVTFVGAVTYPLRMAFKKFFKRKKDTGSASK